MITPAPTKATMRTAQGKELGDIDAMLTVADGVPVPRLEDLPAKRRKKSLLLKTEAVALACGDVRVLSGATRKFQGPPSFPYIPGGDCAGVVAAVPDGAADDPKYPFEVGDRVAARFVEGPRGALAEYAVVDITVCEKLPDALSFAEGGALASAAPATLLAERIRKGERVLVVGGGGGVGSHACQVMRKQGASYLAGVSATPERLLRPPLGYDEALDYTKQDPFSLEEYETDEPFDVVVDLAGGGWLRLAERKAGVTPIVKPGSKGGRYLTLTPDKAVFEAHTLMGIVQPFLLVPLWRAVKSRTWARRSLPAYAFAHSIPMERTHLTRTLEMAREGKLKAVVDPRGPFAFDTAGVRGAFRLQETRHAHGKVVVDVKVS